MNLPPPKNPRATSACGDCLHRDDRVEGMIDRCFFCHRSTWGPKHAKFEGYEPGPVAHALATGQRCGLLPRSNPRAREPGNVTWCPSCGLFRPWKHADLRPRLRDCSDPPRPPVGWGLEPDQIGLAPHFAVLPQDPEP